MKTDIYKAKSVGEAISRIVAQKKEIYTRFTYQNLAKKMGIQKSYLSQFMKGKVSLSTDQLYLACEALNISGSEQEFLTLLLEAERTGIRSRKKSLERRIQAIQRQMLDTQKHIASKPLSADVSSFNEYYHDPVVSVVHSCLLIPHFARLPKELCPTLSISEARLVEILDLLERLTIISYQKTGVKVLIANTHLPKQKSYFRQFAESIRFLCMSKNRTRPDPNGYFFSVTFTADEKVRLDLQRELLELLGKFETKVVSAPEEDVYQLNIDLFSWT